MPTFEMEKLIRDGLRALYVELGQVATYRELNDEGYQQALIEKHREEFIEFTAASDEEKTDEIADAWQVRMDYQDVFGDTGLPPVMLESEQTMRAFMALNGISDEVVEALRLSKFAKKGGFSGRTFLVSLRLDESDAWTPYYRGDPERFREIDEQS